MPNGDLTEIESVELINKGLIEIPKELADGSFVAVHVSSSQFSRVHNRIIRPKSDIYLGKLSTNNKDEINSDYINEKDAVKYKIIPIPRSGISVKINQKYTSTIQKISPGPFQSIFNDLELGAGASIYCKSQNELHKNHEVVKGWGCNESDFYKYFEVNYNIAGNLEDIEYCNKIKIICNKAINDKVNSSEKLLNLFFTGEGMFEDPYFAPWLLVNNKIVENKPKKLTVTTGSGRSSGTYQLVFKIDNTK
jgi:hypothetical protein